MAYRFNTAPAGLLCGTALALCVGNPALARDLDAETTTADPNVISLDPIEVRQEDAKGDAADRASSVYVADAELEQARLGDLRDLFAGIANVSVGGAIPLTQKIFVNGIDMLNLAISVDGAMQNNRAFHHVSANVFDPGLLKFVRVDPGVAAADTGPNAVAGAVVMETVDAGDLLVDGQVVGGSARASYADNGDTWNGALTLAGRARGWELLLYGRRATGDDYVDGDGTTMTGTAADLTSGLAKVAYESDTGHHLELSAQKLWDSALRNFRANFGPGSGPLVQYDTERSTYAFSYEFTQGGGMWDPEIVLGYSESLVNAPLYEKSEGTTSTLSAKVQNTLHLSEFDTIVAGIDYYDRTGKYQSDIATAPQEEQSTNVGLFVQARFEPTDRWKISTGFRYDYQDFDTVGAGFSDSYSGASVNFSAVYAVTDELSLRAGYSNVFGGVQIEDNYQFWQMSYPGYTWDYSNLKPSRSQNSNIGADWSRGGLNIGGELFWTEIRDVRDGDQNFDFEARGLNLYATLGWADGFARLTYSNSETRRDGETASSYYLLDYGAPLGQIVALEVQQELPQWNMLIGGSVDIALDYSPDPHSVLDSSPLRELDGYQVLNLFAKYYPPALLGVTLRGQVLNVFDETYADRATYGGDYPGFATLNEPGRTLIVEAIARF